tara:strand:- start:1050 stop:1157 length:108 start_codon:yes stop_codon:yes gene_type:complete
LDQFFLPGIAGMAGKTLMTIAALMWQLMATKAGGL